jgi:hypothetical protein
MPYREPWVLKTLNGRSVLDLALDIHMHSRGSCERDPVSQKYDLRALREVVHTRDTNNSCPFDDAVLHLLRTTIHEADYARTKDTYHTNTPVRLVE